MITEKYKTGVHCLFAYTKMDGLDGNPHAP